MDIATMAARMAADGSLDALANDPRAQFGTPARRYIGAELMPERQVSENAYDEAGIRWRTVVATDRTRYSPVEFREGKAIGSMHVSLAESGTGDQFTARDYDGVRAMLGRGGTMEAMTTFLRWADTSLLRPVLENNERKRWEWMAEGVARLRGANGYRENVLAPVIPGQRAVAGGDWADPAYDPWDDIYERATYGSNKGYRLRRIIMSTSRRNRFVSNPNTASRFGRILMTAGAGSNVSTSSGRPTSAMVNALLAEDGIPPLETYDLVYQTMTGSVRFLKEDIVLFVFETDNEENILNTDPDEAPIVIPNTLGYYAIGTPAGFDNPGRVMRITPGPDLPPHLRGELIQTDFPVQVDPEATATLQVP